MALGRIVYFGSTDGRLFALVRAHRPDPLGIRHRRPDQREPLHRRQHGLHHDVRGLDLLPPAVGREAALAHARSAATRSVTRASTPAPRPTVDGSSPSRARGRSSRSTRGRVACSGRPTWAATATRLPPSRTAASSSAASTAQLRAFSVDHRQAPVATVGRRPDPGPGARRGEPRLLLLAREAHVRIAHRRRAGGVALRRREVRPRDRDGAALLLLAERAPRRVPRPFTPPAKTPAARADRADAVTRAGGGDGAKAVSAARRIRRLCTRP